MKIFISLTTILMVTLCLCTFALAGHIDLTITAPTLNEDGVTQCTDLDGYNLYIRNVNNPNYGTDSTFIGNVTNYTWANLTMGQSYCFVATSVDFSGNESQIKSNEVCKTVIADADMQSCQPPVLQ